MRAVNTHKLILCGAFTFALLLSAYLRFSNYHDTLLSPYAGFSTPLYVGGSILFAVLLIRNGAAFNRMGFGFAISLRHIVIALIGVFILQVSSHLLEPLWNFMFGSGRDLGRFEGLEGSFPMLLTLLLMSWTIAALGEEIAFRVVLMGGVKSALGNGRFAVIVALIFQAVIFGLIHMYQGPTGIFSSAFSGLIFGGLVIYARGAIWPAVIAHGLNNSIGLVSLYLGL